MIGSVQAAVGPGAGPKGMVAVPAALGKIAKSASKLNSRDLTLEEVEERLASRRRGRWGLQNEAAHLMPRERVGGCMRTLRCNQAAVTILLSPQGAAHYGGLLTCGSVWMCPICAAKITERRRLELQRAISLARAKSLRVLLVTYTVSHQAHQPLYGLLVALQKAQRRMKSGRAAKDLHERYAVVGSVRALEVTWGQEHGWHPHIHELVFLPIEEDPEAFAGELRELWEAAAGAYGLSMNMHGFDWSDTNERVADYVSKFGKEPEWQEASELTKWHIKRAGGERFTPFGLLEASRAGEAWAGKRFCEYARAFKGKRQLFWSAGLRELLSLGEEKTDEELVEEAWETATVLGELTYVQWCRVVANDVRGELLEVARSGIWEEVQAFVKLLVG